MTVAELRVEWERLYGEPTRSRNRDYLWRRLAWKVQELAHGGLSSPAKARLDAIAPDPFTRAPTPRRGGPCPAPTPIRRRNTGVPSPGTVLIRVYHGRELRLLVLDDGFEYEGQRFGSLSEAARHVTGSRWNGRLFWGLTKRKRNR